MKIKGKLRNKLLGIANKKIDKAIKEDVGDGVSFEIEDLYVHVGKDGAIKVSVMASAETTVGSFMNIYRQIEETN